MQRISQFGVCLLAILLIAAVAQCAVICQTSPLQPAKAETKLPPCHQTSKSSQPSSDCSHPQNALLAAVANLSFEWTAALPAFATLAIFSPAIASAIQAEAKPLPVRVEPPLCLRV